MEFEREKRRRSAKRNNPEWGIIWRILAISAMIDFSLWAYFHYVKGVSIWEGLMQMRSKVQATNSPIRSDHIPFKTTSSESVKIEPKQYSNFNNLHQENNRISENIHTGSVEYNDLEEKRKKHIEDVNQMISEEMKKRNNSHDQIYSWKSENGYRVYSNIGFPKDGNYTEPLVIRR